MFGEDLGPPFRRRSHKNVFHSHAKTKEFYSTFTRFLHARQIEDFATPLNQNARLFYTRPREASCLPGLAPRLREMRAWVKPLLCRAVGKKKLPRCRVVGKT